MANRFVNPFPQFMGSTGAALSGAKLFFYASGGGVKLATYSRSTLTGPANANPVVLNAAGFPPVNIFLQDAAYRVVLAPATDTDPPTSPIWVSDPTYTSDFSTTAALLTFPGNPNGFVAGTAGSGPTPADEIFDTVNKVLYVATTTGNAVTTVWSAINVSATVNVPPPQGRLTPQSLTPVISTDQVGVTSIFYTPYAGGNLTPIFNGTVFSAQAFSELTLALNNPNHVANTIYDVFVFMNGSAITLVTGPAWTSSAAGAGARGVGAATTELTRLNGILVNAVQINGRNGASTFVIPANTATYLGSILIDGINGQSTCQVSFGQIRRWSVWNAYNRKPIVLRAGDGTASWTYNTATIRASNNNAANSLTSFCGLAEEDVNLEFAQTIANKAIAGGPNDVNTLNGIGVNSTVAFSGLNGSIGSWKDGVSVVQNIAGTGYANHDLIPGLGINTITALEKGNGIASVNSVFFGTSASMLLSARWAG